MSDPSSVFDQENNQEQDNAQKQPTQGGQEQPNDTTQTPSYADRLAKIVNERGEPKYKDVETALDALGHSQQYIQQLQRELDEARAAREAEQQEEDRLRQVEESLRRLAESQQNNQPTPPEFQGLTEEQIDSLLKNRLNEHEQQKLAQENVRKVSEAIRTQYGEKTQETVAQKAEAYGLSPQEFEQMAAKSPQMVLDIFGVKPHQPKQSFSSSVNIPPINPQQESSLTPPEKSLMKGASDKDIMDYMKRVQAEVYRRHGIEE